jgi:hypothetical protein
MGRGRDDLEDGWTSAGVGASFLGDPAERLEEAQHVSGGSELGQHPQFAVARVPPGVRRARLDGQAAADAEHVLVLSDLDRGLALEHFEALVLVAMEVSRRGGSCRPGPVPRSESPAAGAAGARAVRSADARSDVDVGTGRLSSASKRPRGSNGTETYAKRGHRVRVAAAASSGRKLGGQRERKLPSGGSARNGVVPRRGRQPSLWRFARPATRLARDLHRSPDEYLSDARKT